MQRERTKSAQGHRSVFLSEEWIWNQRQSSNLFVCSCNFLTVLFCHPSSSARQRSSLNTKRFVAQRSALLWIANWQSKMTCVHSNQGHRRQKLSQHRFCRDSSLCCFSAATGSWDDLAWKTRTSFVVLQHACSEVLNAFCFFKRNSGCFFQVAWNQNRTHVCTLGGPCVQHCFWIQARSGGLGGGPFCTVQLSIKFGSCVAMGLTTHKFISQFGPHPVALLCTTTAEAKKMPLNCFQGCHAFNEEMRHARTHFAQVSLNKGKTKLSPQYSYTFSWRDLWSVPAGFLNSIHVLFIGSCDGQCKS